MRSLITNTNMVPWYSFHLDQHPNYAAAQEPVNKSFFVIPQINHIGKRKNCLEIIELVPYIGSSHSWAESRGLAPTSFAPNPLFRWSKEITSQHYIICDNQPTCSTAESHSNRQAVINLTFALQVSLTRLSVQSWLTRNAVPQTSPCTCFVVGCWKNIVDICTSNHSDYRKYLETYCIGSFGVVGSYVTLLKASDDISGCLLTWKIHAAISLSWTFVQHCAVEQLKCRPFFVGVQDSSLGVQYI